MSRPDPAGELTLTARWVFPVSSPPLEGGTVTVRGDRIAAVGPRGGRAADVDLGNAALIPGLVNAHTHLDLSGLRSAATPGPDFTGWLRRVVAARRARPPGQVREDVRAGLREALAFGTTLIGDIAAAEVSREELAAAPVWSVVYRELIGLPDDRAARAIEEARDWLRGHPASEHCRAGLSPHAPYSVRASLFAEVAQIARAANVPVAVHIAEAAEETTLLAERAGPFVDFLAELGVWDPGGLVAGHAELLALFRGCRTAWVHGNHLPPGTARGAAGEWSRVWCPRTHAAFGHTPYPLPECLAAGERVALGTDSLASSPDLDVLAEARLARRLFPGVPGEALLRAATLGGAEALGFAAVTGSLEAGKSADLLAVPLPDLAAADPYELLFAGEAPAAWRRRVMWRGAWRGENLFPASLVSPPGRL